MCLTADRRPALVMKKFGGAFPRTRQRSREKSGLRLVVGVRDGLIVSHRACESYDEALSLVGLEEPVEDPAA
jgi:hypothetical protein